MSGSVLPGGNCGAVTEVAHPERKVALVGLFFSVRLTCGSFIIQRDRKLASGFSPKVGKRIDPVAKCSARADLTGWPDVLKRPVDE